MKYDIFINTWFIRDITKKETEKLHRWIGPNKHKTFILIWHYNFTIISFTNASRFSVYIFNKFDKMQKYLINFRERLKMKLTIKLNKFLNM